MMIHLVDQDTKETFKSFDDNEVQAAIAAARASGKIVNMELDDDCKDCLIYIAKTIKGDLDVSKLSIGESNKTININIPITLKIEPTAGTGALYKAKIGGIQNELCNGR